MEEDFNTIHCALCGFEFKKDEHKCAGCAINTSCKTICCPHCGYQTVDDSGIRKIFLKLRRLMQCRKK